MNSKNCISINKFIFSVFISFICMSFNYQEPNYCKIIDQITHGYLKEMAVPRGLTLTGYGGAMANDIQSVTLRFLSKNILNVREARILYVEMMENFLCRVNSHGKIRPYLHDFPFGIDNIKLTIGFVDSEGHTRRDGGLTLMFIGKNHELFYCGYDSNAEDFYDLHQELYEEAFKLVEECSTSNTN